MPWSWAIANGQSLRLDTLSRFDVPYVHSCGFLPGWRSKNRLHRRRRWATEGLSSLADVQGDLTVGGKAWLIDVNGDLSGASVAANGIATVVVAGRITSTSQEWIRSVLAGSSFYVSDSTWSGYISEGVSHVFDGGVTAWIGA